MLYNSIDKFTSDMREVQFAVRKLYSSLVYMGFS